MYTNMLELYRREFDMFVHRYYDYMIIYIYIMIKYDIGCYLILIMGQLDPGTATLHVCCPDHSVL